MITLILSLIMAMICFSLLLLFYFNKQWEISGNINERLERNVTSAINLLLTDTSENLPSIDSMDLFNKKNATVTIARDRWGLYNLGQIKCFSGDKVKSRMFLYGSLPENFFDGCVYLADHQATLYLTGETKLIGNVYLSHSGVQPGFVNQRGYNFTELVAGKVLLSNKTLPELDAQFKSYLLNFITSAGETHLAESGMSIALARLAIKRSLNVNTSL